MMFSGQGAINNWCQDCETSEVNGVLPQSRLVEEYVG